MNKKKCFYILTGIVLLLILVVNIYVSTIIQPKIVFTAEITKASDQIYYQMQNKYANKDITQFKNISVQIKVTAPMGVNNNVKIDRDILEKYLSKYKKIQPLGGGSFEYPYENEYSESLEVYLGGLSEDELRNILGNFKYKVTWDDSWNNKSSKIFYLRDYLK